MSVKHSIADRLRQARGRLSQAKAAQKIGTHTNTIGKYERGERSPDAEFLVNFCLEFKVQPNWLLFGNGPMHTDECGDSGSLPANQLDMAERLVLDLMEAEGIALKSAQYAAVVDILRNDILNRTRAIMAIAKISHQSHSLIGSTSRSKVEQACGRLFYVLEWTEEEIHAWLLANYGVHSLKDAPKFLENIAGHLYDILAEKEGADAAGDALRHIDCIVFPYREDASGMPLTLEEHMRQYRADFMKYFEAHQALLRGKSE